MRERSERVPVAGTAAERAEAAAWTEETVLRLDSELAELRERFETRGRVLIRCRRIANTFQNAEMALKSLRLLLDGMDISEEDRDHR